MEGMSASRAAWDDNRIFKLMTYSDCGRIIDKNAIFVRWFLRVVAKAHVQVQDHVAIYCHK